MKAASPDLPVQGAYDPLVQGQRMLGDAWLLTLLGTLVGIAVPWFLRSLPLDLGPVSWAVFVCALAYLAVSRAIGRVRSARVAWIALTALQAAALAILAGVWHLAGSIQNPVFLAAFALPIAASGLVLPGARAFGLSIIAVASVWTVALANAPQLGWYLAQLGLPAALGAPALPSAPRPFAGLDVPAAALFAWLCAFTALAGALSLLAHAMALAAAQTRARLDAAVLAAGDASALAMGVIRALPVPCALVYADTLRVAHCSTSFEQRMGLVPEQVAGQGLLDLVAFRFPEAVRETIVRGEGDIDFATHLVAGVSSAARVRVSRVDHAGIRYALVVIEDIAERFALQAAMGAMASAIVVIGEDERVRYFNAAAAAMLPGLELGAPAATPLAQPDGAGWWRLGERGRREREVTLGGRRLEARCIAASAPGRQDHVTVVELVSP